MAPPTESSLPTTTHSEVRAEIEGETTVTELDVQGNLPAGLSGRLLAIGPDSALDSSGIRAPDAHDAMIHSIHLHAGRVISYRSRWVLTGPLAGVRR